MAEDRGLRGEEEMALDIIVVLRTESNRHVEILYKLNNSLCAPLHASIMPFQELII
jgi:hypothetical protein